MNTADKLTTVAENEQKVYEAGQKAEYDRFWDTYQQNGNRENYCFAFAGRAWAALVHEIKYPIKIVEPKTNSGYCQNMFAYFNWASGNETFSLYDFTELSKKIDFSGCKGAASLFQNACVDNITIDFSNLEAMSQTFGAGNGGGGMQTVTLTLTEKCKNFYNPFYYQRQLKNLTFTDGSVIAANIAFAQSSLLTAESVQSIVNALQDRTGQTALKVTFHSTVAANLTADQMSTILAKNWEIG